MMLSDVHNECCWVLQDKSKNAAPMYGAQMAPPPQQHMHGGQYPPQQYPPPSGAAPAARY